jgi:hypothetical protein
LRNAGPFDSPASLVNALALLVVVILTLAGLIHAYWAFGGKTPRIAAVPDSGGRPAFSPSRTATLAVAAGLFAAAYVVAASGQLIASPLGRWARVATFGLSAIFLARAVGDFRLVGIFKEARTSRFARQDTWVYSPLCLGVALAAGYVAYHDV